MKTRPKTQGAFRVDCPGKITPYLHVLSRRDDGYHDVQLALVPVSLYDSLTFTLDWEGGVRLIVESETPLGPDMGNLVWRAARAFQQATAEQVSVLVRITKRIPVGAGMGGGSADAAATLVAMNRLYREPFNPPRLRALAAELGMDVPFFIDPRPMRASGRGEVLEPLDGFPELQLLVVQPPFSVSTREAYGLVTPGGARPLPGIRDAEDAARALSDDFEGPIFERHPELARIRQALLDAGALGAGMSGTGSALFGIFPDVEARDRAAFQLKLPDGCRVHPCHTLSGHGYRMHDAEPDIDPSLEEEA